MKWVVSVVGVLVAVVGLFWILQGTGIVPVGLMAHQMQFAYEGAGLIVVGAGLIWFVNRRSGPAKG